MRLYSRERSEHAVGPSVGYSVARATAAVWSPSLLTAPLLKFRGPEPKAGRSLSHQASPQEREILESLHLKKLVMWCGDTGLLGGEGARAG
jgi:hypothetical protein